MKKVLSIISMFASLTLFGERVQMELPTQIDAYLEQDNGDSITSYWTSSEGQAIVAEGVSHETFSWEPGQADLVGSWGVYHIETTCSDWTPYLETATLVETYNPNFYRGHKLAVDDSLDRFIYIESTEGSAEFYRDPLSEEELLVENSPLQERTNMSDPYFPMSCSALSYLTAECEKELISQGENDFTVRVLVDQKEFPEVLYVRCFALPESVHLATSSSLSLLDFVTM
ncbi:MAG: hypothetical protein S4CHLAM81_13630 [Chlamydiales bacterium]|nr:hypothetical protein [Chlamydiales bacterium]MCH9636135.1 hypothetical protein [Chlamydiales bacterium]MCH9703410.1 hypothetical protein [Chlamydiota bacterium]